MAASFLVLGILSWLWLNQTRHNFQSSEKTPGRESWAGRTTSSDNALRNTKDMAGIIPSAPAHVEMSDSDQEKKRHQTIAVQSGTAEKPSTDTEDNIMMSSQELTIDPSDFFHSTEVMYTHHIDMTPNQKEADSLLCLAQSRLKEKRIRDIKSRYQLNPDKLLAEAERKSDETLLKKLVKNVQSTSEQVLTAVVNRNYEK